MEWHSSGTIGSWRTQSRVRIAFQHMFVACVPCSRSRCLVLRHCSVSAVLHFLSTSSIVVSSGEMVFLHTRIVLIIWLQLECHRPRLASACDAICSQRHICSVFCTDMEALFPSLLSFSAGWLSSSHSVQAERLWWQATVRQISNRPKKKAILPPLHVSLNMLLSGTSATEVPARPLSSWAIGSSHCFPSPAGR